MELTQEFRILILKAFIKDFNFTQKFIDYLKPEYFETIPEKVIFSTFKDYFNKYKRRPLLEEMMQLTIKYKDDELVNNVIRMVYKEKHINVEYLTKELKDFCLHQELKATIVDAHNNLLPDLKFDQIFDNIKKAITFKDKFDDLGTDYLISLDKRLEMQRQQELETFYIPTGILGLDGYIKGLKAPQVGVILAPPKLGKSMFLAQVAQNALFYKKNIIYYTFELSEDDICNRLDSCVTGIPLDNLENCEGALRKKLDFIRNTFKSNIIVKYYPTRKATVNTLYSHIRQLENVKHFIPDLIIIDYPGRMKPLTDRKDKRLEVEDIFLDIIGLAGELNVPIWTAHQSSREGINNEDIGMEHFSESLEPARGCDIILGMSATNNQKLAGLCNIHIMGSRNGKDGVKLYAERQAERMRIKSINKDDYKRIMSEFKANNDIKEGKTKDEKVEKAKSNIFKQK